jgi:hypothetical protein
MRKNHEPLPDDGPSKRRFKYSAVMTIMLGIALAPLAYESGLVCYARWKGMTGAMPQVETPVFDAIGRTVTWATHDLQQTAKSTVHSFAWKPTYMIPFIMFWTVIALFLLRSRT